MLTELTKENLLQYYGALRHELTYTYDYFERRTIEDKIDALEVLLDIKKNNYEN